MTHLRKIVAAILGAVVGSACLLLVGAIANAIYDAVGVRMYHVPMNPSHVLARMLEEGK